MSVYQKRPLHLKVLVFTFKGKHLSQIEVFEQKSMPFLPVLRACEIMISLKVGYHVHRNEGHYLKTCLQTIFNEHVNCFVFQSFTFVHNV